MHFLHWLKMKRNVLGQCDGNCADEDRATLTRVVAKEYLRIEHKWCLIWGVRIWYRKRRGSGKAPCWITILCWRARRKNPVVQALLTMERGWTVKSGDWQGSDRAQQGKEFAYYGGFNFFQSIFSCMTCLFLLQWLDSYLIMGILILAVM